MLKNLLPFRLRRLGPEEFAAETLRVLREHYPQESFDTTSDPQILLRGEVELGLQNLYATYIASSPTRRQLADLIIEHFARLHEHTRQAEAMDTLPWTEAAAKIKPQLMPAEYLNLVPVAHMVFVPGVHIGLVLDLPKAYSYVRQEDLERWGLSIESAFEQATLNLNADSGGIRAHALDSPTRLIALETNDGFDAARILLPGIRRFASQHVGDPFFAGFPNRDFLMMWATDVPADFHAFNLDKLQRDYGSQPYPLSPLAHKVSVASLIPP